MVEIIVNIIFFFFVDKTYIYWDFEPLPFDDIQTRENNIVEGVSFSLRNQTKPNNILFRINEFFFFILNHNGPRYILSFSVERVFQKRILVN